MYTQRVMLGGWTEEIFWSLYQIALLQEILEMPSSVFLESYEKAYKLDPSRLEPLYRLINYYRREGNYAKGYELSSLAMKMPPSSSILFIERWIEEYALPLEHAFLSLQYKKYEEGEKIYRDLLLKPRLPPEEKNTVIRNLNLLEEVKKSSLF